MYRRPEQEVNHEESVIQSDPSEEDKEDDEDEERHPLSRNASMVQEQNQPNNDE